MTFINPSAMLYPNCLHCGRELRVVGGFWDVCDTFTSLCQHSDACLCQLPNKVLRGMLCEDVDALVEHRRLRGKFWRTMALPGWAVELILDRTVYPLSMAMREDIKTILAFRLVTADTASCVSVLETAVAA